MPKLKLQTKWDMTAKIISSIVILLILIQAVIYSFSIREFYNINLMKVELISSSVFRLDYFIVDFIFCFIYLAVLALFPLTIVFNGKRDKSPCVIYLLMMTAFSVESVVLFLTNDRNKMLFHIICLLSEICCCISSVIILKNSEKISGKIIAVLLQLPYILVGITACINYFSLFNVIMLLLSPLFIIFLFSLNNEYSKISLINSRTFIIISIILSCIYLATLAMVNVGLIN